MKTLQDFINESIMINEDDRPFEKYLRNNMDKLRKDFDKAKLSKFKIEPSTSGTYIDRINGTYPTKWGDDVAFSNFVDCMLNLYRYSARSRKDRTVKRSAMILLNTTDSRYPMEWLEFAKEKLMEYFKFDYIDDSETHEFVNKFANRLR